MPLTALALSVLLSAHADSTVEEPSESVAQDSIAPASLLREGWMLIWERDHIHARPLAAALLTQDDTSLASHWLYLNAWYSDTEGLVHQYRGWHEAAADDPVRSAALAASILVNENEAGAWCDEAEALLDVTLSGPTQTFWLHRLRHMTHRTCDRDTDTDIAAIAAMSGDLPEAARYLIKARVQAGQIDAALLREITAQSALDPWALNDIVALWGRSVEDSRWTRKARRVARAAARTASSSANITDKYSAWRLLDWSDDTMAVDIRPALDAHFGVEDAEVPDVVESSISIRELYDAEKSPTNEGALARLNALSDAVPEHGRHRATLEGLRGSRLSNLGRHQDALVSLRRAWEEDPSPSRANAFAWEATIAAQDMALALQAITDGIDEILSQSYADAAFWQNYTTWRARYARQASQYLDTRGWLLFKMDRPEEAVAALQQSISMQDLEDNHHHLAMVLLALDERTAAFEGLVQASIAAEGAPSDVVYAALEATYLDGGVWHPDGLDGYLDYRLSLDSLDDDDDGEEGHALLGEPFPFTAYTDLRGREQPLEVGGSILVVDFWATWCGPCIYGMPHLQAVTDAYADRGVRVIGLSVDDELAPVKALFAGDFQPAYTVGWVGLSGFESGKFRGIPSLFVVDEQGRVNTYIAGYSDGDIRLEKALDALLEESP